MNDTMYHLGFGASDFGESPPKVALLSGDPERSSWIAQHGFEKPRILSERRGLNSYLGLVGEIPVLAATSGMGAPSLSIVVNELVQVGIKTIIRIGTSGSIQPHVHCGSIVISSAAMALQGASDDIAPKEFPAVADPFLTTELASVAQSLGLHHHVGITASVDTFYEGQGRVGGANPHLLRKHQGVIEEYRHLGILNFEMEAGTLFKMGTVYGFRAACVCAVVAQRTASEQVMLDSKHQAVENAVELVLGWLRAFGGN